MSSASNPWNRLTLTGKIILPLVALLVLGTFALVAIWVIGIGPWAYNWVVATGEANIDILRFIRFCRRFAQRVFSSGKSGSISIYSEVERH